MNFFIPCIRASAVMLIAFVFSISAVHAQTTAFTYQGQLNDGVTAANGTYNMQFSLFDALSAGTQIGSTITNMAVTVQNGVFTVQLDFTSSPFTGADRFLLIAVKKPVDASYTPLAPRQTLTSSPYSVKTLSATAADTLSSACVGCVTDAKLATGISYSKLTGVPASLPPSGAAGGDLTGTYPNATIANSSVTSSKILDGTITNSDISTTAAIDGAKISGSNITNLNGSNIATGTVADGRLSGNVTLGGNTFNGTNGLVKLDGSGKLPSIDGSALTNLPAASPVTPFAVFSATSSGTYVLANGTNGTSATRTFFAALGGAVGNSLTIVYTLPPANSYPAGTTIRIGVIDYITSAPSPTYQKTASTSDILHGFNQGTGSGGPGFPGAFSSWTTDGSSNWYRMS